MEIVPIESAYPGFGELVVSKIALWIPNNVRSHELHFIYLSVIILTFVFLNCDVICNHGHLIKMKIEGYYFMIISVYWSQS